MIINEVDAVLIPKNRGDKFSSGFLDSEFLRAALAAMPPLHWLLLCIRVIVIQPGFVYGHPSRQEIIWIAPKKFQLFFRRLAALTFLIRVQAFQDPLRGELPHVQIFMNDGPNPLTWDTQLLSYWFSRNPAGVLPRLARQYDQYSPGLSLFWVVQDEANHKWKNHHV